MVLTIGVFCGIISVVLSFCLPRQGFKGRERFSPILLQVLLIATYGFPCLHGTPGEVVIPTLLTGVWCVFTFRKCWRLYGFPSDIAHALAIVLFVETAVFAFLAILDHVQACLFYHHRLIGDPWS